jgi:hypothetical protein
MLKVGRTLILAAGFTALTFVPAAMLASTARAQTMGEYGATVGSSASSAGTLGSSIGSGTSSVGSNMGGGTGLNMGVGGGDLQPDVVTGHGAPRTVIIGGDDSGPSAYHHPPTDDAEDDGAGDDWSQVR